MYEKQNTFHDSPLSLLFILLTGHLSHIAFANFLDDFAMRDRLAEHENPLTCAVQLRAMLRAGCAKGNGNEGVEGV